MRASRFSTQTCSIARSLEVVGEWWTLLVVREAFFGTRRFSDFEANLGIAKNVLSERLAKLVTAGVLERRPVVGRGNPADYALTAKGRDLFPVIIALMQWGDRWANKGGPPTRVRDRETGEDIAAIAVTSSRGRPLAVRDAFVTAGPGADEDIRRRFGDGVSARGGREFGPSSA
jgi:DNA-binding HxlR family transcriptional regulator